MIKAAQATRGDVSARMQSMSVAFPDALPRELADVLNEVGVISDVDCALIVEHGFDFFSDAEKEARAMRNGPTQDDYADVEPRS
jgi:hypothetical protein